MGTLQTWSKTHDAGMDHSEFGLAGANSESEWSVFRMLIPRCPDEMGYDEIDYIKTAREETKSEISIYDYPNGSGLRTVMVCAKEEAELPTCPAVDGLLAVQKYVFNELEPRHTSRRRCSLTRLLLPIAQARSFIADNIIKTVSDDSGCTISIHLTDSLSILSPDDVILEVDGFSEYVHRAIESIASHMRKFPVCESLISELKIQMGMASPNKISEELEALRHSQHEVMDTKTIPLHYVIAIIGEGGENIKSVRRSSSTIITITATDKADVMGIEIHSPSVPEIKKAEKLMQEFIDKVGGPPSFFECMHLGSIGFCGPLRRLFGGFDL